MVVVKRSRKGGTSRYQTGSVGDVVVELIDQFAFSNFTRNFVSMQIQWRVLELPEGEKDGEYARQVIMKSNVWPSVFHSISLLRACVLSFTFLHNFLKAILPGIHESNSKQKKDCVEKEIDVITCRGLIQRRSYSKSSRLEMIMTT